jgi:gliding motility-associated lipoprotein GldH
MRRPDEGRAGKGQGAGLECTLIVTFAPKRIRLKNLSFFFPVILLAASVLALASCTFPSGVFEKNVVIPGQQWASSFRPRIDFTIGERDTSNRYNIFLVLRHTDAYDFNNIWIKGTLLSPGDSMPRTQRYDLPLATNTGWTGNGMDDIFEHRVQIQQQTKFNKPGTYSMELEQIMREDPLKHVLNVGIRIEKEK